MNTLKKRLIALLLCTITSFYLLTPCTVAHAEISTYNAVLDFGEKNWSSYYPSYNASMEGNSPGRLTEGAPLRYEYSITNKNNVDIAYCYSFDLNRYVYITSKYVKLLSTEKMPLSDGLYVITPKCAPNSALDVTDWGTDNCTNIQIWEKTGGENQTFYLKRTEDGAYVLESAYCPGMVIDVEWGSDDLQTNIQLYEANDTKAQSFFLEPADNGYFYIVSALNKNLVLDIASASTSNGTNVWLYSKNETAAQMFSFEKVTNKETYNYNNYTYDVLPSFSNYAYNQNDYDRYLNASGRNIGCTATALASAYSIANPDNAITPASNNIKWTTGVGVTWTTHCTWLSSTENLSQAERLKKAYKYITEEETPVIIRLDKKNTTSGHSVTIVGVRQNINLSSLTPDDFLVIDPWGGKICSLRTSMGTNYTISRSWALIIPKKE